MFFAPVSVALEELAHLGHVLDAGSFVVFPDLLLLRDYQGKKVLKKTLKFGKLQNHLDQGFLINRRLHQFPESRIAAVVMQHDPPNRSVGLP
jgi:hypothetical protein